jgi:saccharopine dehydrogenase-like NADP-dependent oxidoreductase
MKKILLFGAGKSATTLIAYLIGQTRRRDWQLIVADSDLSLARSKIGGEDTARVKAVALSAQDKLERETFLPEADIVISLLPPGLHDLIAQSCIEWKKDLLTASYLDEPIRALGPAIRQNGLLFLCEMGLDPGIDHMSAMQLIHRIHTAGGRIHSFRSHTGGLIAPESDDNPWHYKISWNPRNVVTAGSAGGRYKENGLLVSRRYEELFENCEEISTDGIGPLAWYPNRDSLGYIPIYGLEETSTFIRTTLRYPVFCRAWKAIVKAGLTDDTPILQKAGGQGAAPPPQTFASWSAPIRPFIDQVNLPLLKFLGLFDDTAVPLTAHSSADILQYLLETRLAMRDGDMDMIVMLHEIGYETREGKQMLNSSLIVKGEDRMHTAMAKTVGLPLGIAAKLILEKKIGLSGLHIPILPAIYEPVLAELEKEGVRFKETYR